MTPFSVRSTIPRMLKRPSSCNNAQPMAQALRLKSHEYRQSWTFLNYSIRFCFIIVGVVAAPELFAQFIDSSQPQQTNSTNNMLIAAVIVLLAMQTLLIIGLQHNRLKNKQAKDELARSQKALENRVVERTDRLRGLNNQLYDEIAKHEITEELLQEAQDYMQSIINSMPSILIGVTREGIITHWNVSASHATEVPAADALGKHLHEVAPELNIDLKLVQSAIDKGITRIKENTQTTGQEHNAHYTDMAIYPLQSEIGGAVIRIDDVSMRVRLEQMMIQNEKMMSLGELAAGTAHEINNPLSAILHGVQNIYRRTSSDLEQNLKIAEKHGIDLEKMRMYLNDRGIFKFIDGIREAGERSASIVTNMLEFSRSGHRHHEMINIVELIEHSLDLAMQSSDFKSNTDMESIDIKKDFQTNLPFIRCSAAEIQQVLINLFRNAAQAFSNKEYGAPLDPTISIVAKTVQSNMVIEVTDNGPGMPDNVKRHIFEPFFTTKEVGKGTGLGLSISYFIINEHHDGRIEVDSTPGRGTTFRISLPVETAETKEVKEEDLRIST